MSQSNIKDIRKQLRNVVQEEMGNILTNEMKLSLYRDLSDKIQKQLNEVTKYVKETLDRIDERSKDIQTYAINQSAVVAPPALNVTPAKD